MTSAMKRASQIALGAAIFVAGIAAGSLHARSAAVQNRFGQPKTVLHVVVYKFRDNVSNYDRERAINGVKDMAGKMPGIKTVWLKTARNQIKDFSGVYAIEFTSAEAAADYAESPVHEAWSKMWQEQRENSLSFSVSNTAQTRPQITQRARYMKRAQRCGRSSVKTVFPFRFRPHSCQVSCS